MIQARYPLCNDKEKIRASWTEMSGKGQMFVKVERHEEKREENVTPFRQFFAFKTTVSWGKYKLHLNSTDGNIQH